MRYLITFILACLMGLCSCDMLQESADTTKDGGEGAVGIADKMREGTLKDADLDTGESSSEDPVEESEGDS